MTIAKAGGIVRPDDFADTLATIEPTSWSPTWTNVNTGTGPTVDGFYYELGPFVYAYFTVTMGTSPSWTGIASFTLPVDALSGTVDQAIGSWVYRDNSTTDFYAGTASLLSSTSARMAGAWNGTLPVDMLGQGGTSPVSLAVNDKISVQLWYPKA